MNNNTLPKTPTLDKMQEIQDSSQICGQFLEWLQSKFAMFKLDTTRNEPVYHGSGDYINIEETLAEFFDIDLAFTTLDVFGALCTTLNPLSRFCPPPANEIPVYSVFAPSPFNILLSLIHI